MRGGKKKKKNERHQKKGVHEYCTEPLLKTDKQSRVLNVTQQLGAGSLNSAVHHNLPELQSCECLLEKKRKKKRHIDEDDRPDSAGQFMLQIPTEMTLIAMASLRKLFTTRVNTSLMHIYRRAEMEKWRERDRME